MLLKEVPLSVPPTTVSRAKPSNTRWTSSCRRYSSVLLDPLGLIFSPVRSCNIIWLIIENLRTSNRIEIFYRQTHLLIRVRIRHTTKIPKQIDKLEGFFLFRYDTDNLFRG
jgi:hypothetical protein